MLRNFFLTVIGSLGTLLLGLGSSVMAARLLGPALRGELAALQLLPLGLVGIASFGFPQALAFHTARSPARAGELLGSTLAACFVFTVPVAALGALALPLLVDAYGPGFVTAARWYLLGMLPLSIFAGLPSSSVMGLKAYLEFNLLRLIPATVYLVALATAFVRPDPRLIALAFFAGTLLVVTPLVAWITGRVVRQRPWPSWAGVKLLLPYASVSWLTTLPQLGGARLDQFFVLARLDAASLGLYAIAQGIGGTIQGLQAASGALLLPYLAGEASASPQQRQLFGRILRLSLLSSLLGLAALLIALPWLLPLLFGRAFLPALVPAGLLLASSATNGINSTFSDGFRGLDRSRLVLCSETLNVAAKAALLVLCYRQLTLPLAAAVALAGALAALLFNAFAFHLVVEPLGWSWLRGAGPDLALLSDRLSARLRAALRR